MAECSLMLEVRKYLGSFHLVNEGRKRNLCNAIAEENKASLLVLYSREFPFPDSWEFPFPMEYTMYFLYINMDRYVSNISQKTFFI